MGKYWDNEASRKTPSSELLKFCKTDRQLETLSAYIKYETSADAAKALGITERAVRNAVETVKKNAAKEGWTESFDATRFVDPGQVIIGKSTLTKDDEGNTVWIKTKAQQEYSAEHSLNSSRDCNPRSSR